MRWCLLNRAQPLHNDATKPMMIHVMRDGQQFGPYTLEDVNAYLAQGTLLATDQAWYEGTPEWMLITQVPGVLASGAAPAPGVAAPGAAVVDPMAAASPAVAAAVISAGNQGSKKKKIMIIAGSSVAVVAIALVLCFVYPGFLKDDAGRGGDEGGGGGSGAGGGSGGGGTFATVVQPILKKSTCYDCHDGSGGDKVKGKFDLANTESVTGVVAAGDDANSELIARLTDTADPMPPEDNGEMLSADDVNKIKAWINAGAKF
jgi:hypothetical protein